MYVIPNIYEFLESDHSYKRKEKKETEYKKRTKNCLSMQKSSTVNNKSHPESHHHAQVTCKTE